jgi:hypothetical protein
MGKFEDVSENVYEMMKNVIKEHFPELVNARFKILFSTKKKTSGGKICFAWIQKTNDLIRHLTTEEADSEDGYDYIIYIDKLIWDNIEETDRIRLMRHELRHTHVDLESSSNPYKIRGHSIEDFYSEIELNKDDPRWAQRVAVVAESLYSRDQ